MSVNSAVAIWLPLLLACYFIFSHLWSRLAYAQNVKKHGCSRPTRYPHKDFIFGLDLFRLRKISVQEGSTLSFSTQQFKRYGATYEAVEWGRRLIFTSDPRTIQSVLALQCENFGVAPIRKHSRRNWLGPGIITTDGETWNHSRSLLKPVFARARFADLSTFEHHVSEMIGLIPRDGSPVDLQSLLKRLFLDVSTEFLFGESANSLRPESSRLDFDEFLGTFDEALIGNLRNMQFGHFNFLLGPQTKWRQSCAKVHALLDKWIDTALQNTFKDKSKDTASDSTSNRPLNFLDELANKTQDRGFLRDQLLNVFFPAHDSSAIGISDVLFQLARHPDVWQRLRIEVLSIREPLSFELFKSMKYMQSVLNEGLRLYSPSGRTVRECFQDCVLPQSEGKAPIFVTRGMRIDIDWHAMQRDPHIWGQDANDFRPERWEKIKPQWEYIPFSGGPRICPAQQMVLTQYAYILVRLMREFERMENRDPEFAFVEEHRMTKQSKNGVKVAMIPAPNDDGL